MKIAQELFYEIIKLYRPFEKALAEELKKHKLRRADWTVLFYLYNYETVTQVTISEYLGVKKPTVTRTFTRLEQLGYVKQIAGGDRREKRMQLTEAGVDVYEAARTSIDQFETEILEGISEEEQKDMIQLMEKIRSNLLK